MTAAASVSFFKPEFDDFLYAPIDGDRDEMPLTVLSALSRMDVDPWEEAAELSELPKDTATQRLALLIERLPGRRWARADTKAIAGRLIELLPRRQSDVGSSGKADGVREMSASTIVVVCVALALGALMLAANLERSMQSRIA